MRTRLIRVKASVAHPETPIGKAMDTTTVERMGAATRELTPVMELRAVLAHIDALEKTLAEFDDPKTKAELYRELSAANARRAEVEVRAEEFRASEAAAEEEARELAEIEAAAAEEELIEEVEHDEEVADDANPEELTEEQVAEADAGHPEALEDEDRIAQLESEGGPIAPTLEEEEEVREQVEAMLEEEKGTAVIEGLSTEDETEVSEEADVSVGELSPQEEEALLAAARAVAEDTGHEHLSDDEILRKALEKE